MKPGLRLYNSLTKKKEPFEPLNPPYVGMYVCGPTVYSDVHLGNVRTFISFDVMYRYLMHLGYQVRYVRNITDVGHLTDDHDHGEDKIAKKARLEKMEPMEVVQKYTNDFHEVMDMFQVLSPSIEPTAIGHISEQIQMVEKLVAEGLAYEVEGSVYFDVDKYNQSHHYGVLSGRVLEELQASERSLEGQDEKRNKNDFALWKKAQENHIMRWPSPWGLGFPGWHLECSVMSTKYLGETFDIHGGGMDLKFPHHECEIAQCVGSTGKAPVKYWLHANMLTVNGQKMSKSLGNSFLPRQLINGDHELLDKGYSPMSIRFFMLQSHYSSTLDISNEALRAAEKGYKKLMNGLKILRQPHFVHDDAKSLNEKAAQQVDQAMESCYRAMNDDFNTAQTIAQLFNLLKKINGLQTGNIAVNELGEERVEKLTGTYRAFTLDVLGLREEKPAEAEPLLQILLDLYAEAKAEKNYEKVDEIRNKLKGRGITLKDMRSGVDWAYEE